MIGNFTFSLKEAGNKLKKNAAAAVLLILGLVLLILPRGAPSSDESQTADAAQELTHDVYSVENTEKKLEEVLGQIDGAGRVSVMLTLKSSTEALLAENSERRSGGEISESSATTVTVGSGANEQAVTLGYIYPEYLGAVVVAEGAGSTSVRLAITEAVAAVTGLGADKITVAKMK